MHSPARFLNQWRISAKVRRGGADKKRMSMQETPR
jgi:hypothetical protein